MIWLTRARKQASEIQRTAEQPPLHRNIPFHSITQPYTTGSLCDSAHRRLFQSYFGSYWVAAALRLVLANWRLSQYPATRVHSSAICSLTA